MLEPFSEVDELFDVLRVDERQPIIDKVGELAHNLQCADRLFEAFPDDIELAVAGLVHDVGSSSALQPRPAGDHGQNGAILVGRLLGARVADLVRLHVPAKRYLVTTDPGYRSVLSADSTHTLGLQGDVMDDNERAAFTAEAHWREAVELRRADDRAKEPGCATSTLDDWRPRVDALVGG